MFWVLQNFREFIKKESLKRLRKHYSESTIGGRTDK